jgi:thiamine biosynthesis lipoprotein
VRRPRAAATAVALLVALATLLAGCEQPPRLRESRIEVFGTWVDLALWGVDDATAARAERVIRGDLDDLHTRWHAWQPGELSRINDLIPAGEPIDVDPTMAPVLARARELSLESGSLFNPAIGRLVDLWGFHADAPAIRTPPSESAIRELVAAAPTMADLAFDGTSLTVANPAVRLDLGAFAKGYGVDIAIGRLRDLGVANALVNAGGDLRAIGRRGDRAWRVGIRNPDGGLLGAIEVADGESVFTSGTYEREFEYAGVSYHHIIDPRTGHPARGLSSATVVGRDGAEADAAATALLVAGPDGWPATARMLGIEAVLVVDEAGGLWATPEMDRRLQFLDDPPPDLGVVPLPEI